MKRVWVLALALLPVFVSGCGPTAPKQPKFIDDIRPFPPALKEVSYAIQRKDLERSLELEGEAPPRLVPVYA